ncbi:hypothetical protein GQ55_2G067900 [Panicum hallii var. hallii]|uniref:F-box domain-containing protein n=1 Tax=Panicum hallii var. hallii TaxID=1504633 RepID=A0A2T7EM63_9POAL|nr:hypothetical protein GQ55_2G067900 [Panicum hallii var. hallii]
MAPTTRAMRALAAASADRLPPDALFDTLLRLPAREICRLRAVSRSWRSLTSDPVFVRAHAAAHPGPLFVAKFRDNQTDVYVLDLAGNVLKRISGVADASVHVLCARLNLACLATDWNRCRVLNPATGAVQILPRSPAPQHRNRANLSEPYTFFALGLVASTGEYKVFRMFNRLDQVFEVLTVSSSTGQSCWRAKPKPSFSIQAFTGVVVDAVVYFLISKSYIHASHTDARARRPDHIMSFDLEREEWRRGLTGPVGGHIASVEGLLSDKYRLDLAELKGSLVLVYKRRQQLTLYMELWFLKDFENGLWAKEYTIQAHQLIVSVADNLLSHVKPVLVLDDGSAGRDSGHIWDPRSNLFAHVVETRVLDSVGIYTGSLLSLQ